ncbi:MAG: hypothetical protein JXB00_20770 [Bacteroidales bacterium]|nr:hypothetical protein [Bacteroidales bacterium]
MRATEGKGYLILNSRNRPRSDNGTIEQTGENEYRLLIPGNGEEIIVDIT